MSSSAPPAAPESTALAKDRHGIPAVPDTPGGPRTDAEVAGAGP